jgi:hypothetical protein
LRGSIRLETSTGGRIGVVGLRFSSVGAITTLPALAK